ncbi:MULTISPECIES: M24 family metallopeptidase [unclassified Leeuwenhoekiella]|uniref:M24 family metallopeptidase n=1 Tax=unclassified Leeuwenhoekiella TaxID=2615029 RepID=UPI000C3CA99E|nr:MULTISPECIES: M24 family metallopeptidase [unclassified Leeuwenhoekiella]MAW96721.1 Xaa-Pro aminopeptidase [Leeuwenhoekiella sp.]MBA81610.1 Xaa-Pro aminopeptidase [Leeuwenhoekiella sp.]|tara:strand:- start:37081 stop:38400 length:1320 start_codon:yes stop_codon:yes gene_type:complete
MIKYFFFLSFMTFSTVTISAQILPERERAQKVDQILKQRFEEVMPPIMERAGIDMWILITREYNEDPVVRTMLPATWLNARRRTILVFNKNPGTDEVERMAVARYNFGDNIQSVWDKEKQQDQWQALADLVEARDPKTIGLNFSEDYGIADGITKTDYEGLMQALPSKYKERIVSAEPLAVGWIETRTELEMEIFEELVATTHAVIAEAFSNKVITPGETTTEDVVWFLRQKVTDLGYDTWFHPTVDIQRTNEELESHITAFSNTPDGKVILPGDLLHCDFGISYLRLNTDCQQHVYVLKEGETEAPQFLVDAFAKGNRVQDIFTANFETGKSGNEILLESLTEAKAEGLRPSIYTHPLGLYGHSAGPTIGMWDAQEGVPGSGDYPLYENTAYAIELNTTVNIPEWNKDIRIMLEEAGFWGPEGFRYVNERQENLILID